MRRQIKIVEGGFLENEHGHIIECPKKFKQCHNTCAWFSVREYPSYTAKLIKPDYECQQNIIGESIDEMP